MGCHAGGWALPKYARSSIGLARERGWLAGKKPMLLFILAWVPAFAEAATRRQVVFLFAKKKELTWVVFSKFRYVHMSSP